MKKIFLVCLTGIMLTGTASAGWMEDLKNRAKEEAEKELEPVVGDIGSVIGADNLGVSLGFPGAEGGANVAINEISDTQLIDTGSDYLVFPMAKAGAAIPLTGGISLHARGMGYQLPETDHTFMMIGATARTAILKDRMISPIPGVSGVLSYNRFQVNDIIAVNNLSAGAVVQKGLPFITPYAGLSYDMNKGVVQITPPDTNEELEVEPSNNFIRIMGGVSLKPIPFTYIDLTASLINENLSYTAGAGVRF
ncbi:MAG: hypothetical protein ACQEQC_02150 [Elusimicrobiota bacterium]